MTNDDLRIDSEQAPQEVPAPDLPYLPPVPKGPVPGIGLIGCGAISSYHLDAYRGVEFPVHALCDTDKARAEERRDTYCPNAEVYTDYRELLARDDVAVIDIATHPEIRAPMIEAALQAGKHVLSQKPFVVDLDEGERLAGLADERGLKLAVNQNGRWAPHLGYIRQAVGAGLLGEVSAAHCAVHWDHSWTQGTIFDDIPHMILYDFGIHWFDMVSCLMGPREPLKVYAITARAPGQTNHAPLLAHATIEYDDALASLTFDGYTLHGTADTTFVTGANATITSDGPDLNHQTVTLYTSGGVARPRLEGEWFKNGFLGTMAELLCAIEEDREPINGARGNLRSLALCFAAMASADSGEAQVPGSVRKIG